jgi:hypothetical protein
MFVVVGGLWRRGANGAVRFLGVAVGVVVEV